MSYAGFGALSGVGPWKRAIAETDEVYLWRATFTGAEPRNIQDVQAIAGAIGAGQNLGLDLRGIAMQQAGPSDQYEVDAAFTTKLPRVLWLDPTFDTASDIAAKVRAALAGRFPDLQIVGERFEEINDDAPKHPALDFWRFHPIIYEAQFLGSTVPTQAYADFQGLYRGRAEDGLSLKRWPKDEPFEPKPENGQVPQSEGIGTGAILLLAGSAALGWLVYRQLKQQGAAR